MKETITRRALLKGCAALSLGSALGPLGLMSSQRPSSKGAAGHSTLYLCCHGLFAFVFREDHILLLTPDIEEHKFLAGTWRKEGQMEKYKPYSLALGNVLPGNPRPVVGADNLHLSGITKIDLEKSYCQIKLPFPKQFISLRHVNAQFEGKSFRAANAPSAVRFPILQVLKYEISNPLDCRLEGLEDHWKYDPHSTSQQLHMFAEPADLVPDDHAARAFDALIQMFPEVDLTLRPTPGLAPCPTQEPNCPREIQLEQELSLAERNGSCAAQLKLGGRAHRDRGPQPPNCFSVVVGNP